MALSTAIYTLLHNNATVEAAVGDKIYPGIAPFNTPVPFIVVKIGSDTSDYNQTSDDSWTRVELTVVVECNNYTNAETYAGNIKTALKRYSGTVDSIVIDTIVYTGQQPNYYEILTESGSPSGQGVFTREVNFTVITKE